MRICRTYQYWVH